MSQHTHEREIDGRVWTVSEFSASEGLALLAAVGKVLGKPIAEALSGLSLDDNVGIDMKSIARAVSELAERMNEHEIVALIKRILSSTYVADEKTGKSVPLKSTFDAIFSPRDVKTIFKVVLFALEANFDVPLLGLLERQPAPGTGTQDSIPKLSSAQTRR